MPIVATWKPAGPSLSEMSGVRVGVRAEWPQRIIRRLSRRATAMYFLGPILLVDDEPECIQIAEHMLRRAGIVNPLVVRHTGEDAIEYLRHCQEAGDGDVPLTPSLVLLDLRMPGLDGVDVIRWVRSRTFFDRTKIVLWSGSATPEQFEAARRCGANAIFAKFPSATVFGEVLHTLLTRHQHGPAANEAVSMAADRRTGGSAGTLRD